MYSAKIRAAEEIQLLLPDDPFERDLDGRAVALLAVGLLLIAFPVYGLLNRRTSVN